MAASRVTLAVAMVALLVVSAQAGCKRQINDKLRTELNARNPAPAPQLPLESLPRNFDWNNVDGKGRSLLAPSWNQHIPQYCGSCWLHGTASMIQDRLKIVKKGLGPDVMLARQVILNCAAFHGLGDGCHGGDPVDVMQYMKDFGLPDESCQPYKAMDHREYGKDAKTCPGDGYCMNCMPLNGGHECWEVPSPIRYFVEDIGPVSEKGELPMMNEIKSRGPLVCSMATPTVFDYGYHAGVARDPTNATEVDHDVEVVGWGEEENGLKYWLVRNSWGTYWGQLGFFKLERGVNALQIEAGDCWYATVSWKDEQDVRRGKKVGTMWGIMDHKQAAKVLPEPGVTPRFKKEHRRHRGPDDDAAIAEF
ncbi:papain family cysteine protease [Helicosporidium sp. ATCC 50920]|nr:papain family cysteine protease [Helicosporidium sp. ATCC 50920]|eukprot:KDD75147.1 papain family cysteine protease [Helicosporidium sp. ATCC 50920]